MALTGVRIFVHAVELSQRYAAIKNWLFTQALPFWGGIGLDRNQGGFYEKFDQNGKVIEGIPRRTRVISRQIYSFAAAGRMGWNGDWAAIVNHGAEALFRRCIGKDGLVISTYADDGTAVNEDFDFYDHAFALFALAELKHLGAYQEQAETAALRMLSAMEERFRHPIAGFAEDDRQTVPLRANPHMHFLEACLAHAEFPNASPVWRKWADQVVDMALNYFIDPATGGLREFFDYSWMPMQDARGQLIEPGHQFEWSWLLRRWNRSIGNEVVEVASARLCSIGENYGVNTRGVTIDELWDDFTIRRASARTWPQTERLKACLAEAELSTTSSDREYWETKAVGAITALESFFATEIAGLWHDRLDEKGRPLIAPAPTSTLYHIVCSLEACQDYLNHDY